MNVVMETDVKEYESVRLNNEVARNRAEFWSPRAGEFFYGLEEEAESEPEAQPASQGFGPGGFGESDEPEDTAPAEDAEPAEAEPAPDEPDAAESPAPEAASEEDSGDQGGEETGDVPEREESAE